MTTRRACESGCAPSTGSSNWASMSVVPATVLGMASSSHVSPYGSARDLPSVKEMEQQMAAFRLLGFMLAKDQRKQLKDLQREHRRITETVDMFYSLLARARELLDDLAPPSPALAQMVELAQRDSESSSHSVLGEKREGCRGREGQKPDCNEGPKGSPRVDLRRALRVRPVAQSAPAVAPALVADYADGLTQVQIANKYGLYVQTVRKRLIAAGIDTRARLRVLTDEDLRAARGRGPRSQRQRNRLRTWRRPHDGHPIAGTSVVTKRRNHHRTPPRPGHEPL